jgi:hypothetical protein
MRQLIKAVPQTFEVELTRDEVEYIRDFTSTITDKGDGSKTAIDLFVGTSRLLGYQVKDDGTPIRLTK